jgi:S1-C subfamily serine protease
MRQVYDAYSPAVIGVATEDAVGDQQIGSAFHIGDGFFVTARHVVEGRKIVRVTERNVGRITAVRYHADPRVDLALLSIDFIENASVPAISLGGHLDDWIEEWCVLQPVLLMGFPPVSSTVSPYRLSITGEVNAYVDLYTAPHIHFVLSTVPRGGFSGGPVLLNDGTLLGVLTQGVYREHLPHEQGFALALSVEPVFAMLSHHGLAPRGNRFSCFVYGHAGIFSEESHYLERSLSEAERSDYTVAAHDLASANWSSLEMAGRPSVPIRDAVPAWSPLVLTRSDEGESND